MNILFVTDFYKPHIGGVEKLFSSLAEGLIANADKVTYITWRYSKHLPKQETINGVDIVRVKAPSRLLFSLFALGKIIYHSQKTDLIHTSTYSSAIGAWIGSRLTRKKIIITVHEVWGDLWQKMPFLSSLEKKFFLWFEHGLLRLKFDHYVAVSDFTKEKLIETGIPEHKITRIYNGIDYNLPQWKEPVQPFTFCFFGRAGASKGLDLLVEATEAMIDKHPDVHFKFIISPQIKRVYKQIITTLENLKPTGNIAIHSQLPYSSLINELLNSNCVIIPSLCEGFGFTAVETSAMNIPLISSGKGALPEVVSGQVITLKNYSVTDLVEAMEAAVKKQFDTIQPRKFPIEEFVKNHYCLYNS